MISSGTGAFTEFAGRERALADPFPDAAARLIFSDLKGNDGVGFQTRKFVCLYDIARTAKRTGFGDLVDIEHFSRPAVFTAKNVRFAPPRIVFGEQTLEILLFAALGVDVPDRAAVDTSAVSFSRNRKPYWRRRRGTSSRQFRFPPHRFRSCFPPLRAPRPRILRRTNQDYLCAYDPTFVLFAIIICFFVKIVKISEKYEKAETALSRFPLTIISDISPSLRGRTAFGAIFPRPVFRDPAPLPR